MCLLLYFFDVMKSCHTRSSVLFAVVKKEQGHKKQGVKKSSTSFYRTYCNKYK